MYDTNLGTFKMNFGFPMPMRYIDKKVKRINNEKKDNETAKCQIASKN